MAQTFSFPNYGLFNATYYLQQNPDVATSWTGTPLQHYISYGALEGRAPTAWFNADFYRQAYSDLNNMNALQLFNHYCNYGYNEGRTPMLNFSNFNGARYLLDNPDLVGTYTATNAISHYVQYGEYEGRVAYADNGVVIQPVVNLGNTYTLTTGVDNIDGTQFNDTFNAMLAGANATLNTLQGFDSLDGMGGADTLNAQLYANGAALSVTPRALDNIEMINVAASSDDAHGVTLNLLNAGQVDAVANTGSTTGLTFSNIATGVDLSVNNTGSATVFSYATKTGTQEANLAVDGVTGAAGITIDGVETINLTSSGNASSATLTAANANTVTIAGSADLTLATTGTVAASLWDGSTATGDIDLTIGALTGVLATDVTVNGGFGDDDLDTSAVTQDVSLHGGAGNDILTLGGQFSAADSVDGGLGVNTLSATVAAIQAAGAAALTTVDNIQILEASTRLGAIGTTDVAINASNIDSSISTVDLLLGTDGVRASSITFNTGASTLALGDALNATAVVNELALTLADATAGTGESVLIVKDYAGNENAFDQALIATGIETLSFDTGSTAVGTTQATGAINLTGEAAGSNLSVTAIGSNEFNLGVVTTASTGVLSIDVSGLTAQAAGLTATVQAALSSGTVSITGSAGNDVLNGDADSANTIRGGAGIDSIVGGTAADSLHGDTGADSIYGGGGNDTMTGGEGNDFITVATTGGVFNAGTVSIDGGAGDDVIAVGTTLTTGDVINGGTGRDTLAVTGTIISNFAGATDLDVFRLDATNLSQNLGFYTGTTFDTVAYNIASGSDTVTGAAATVTDVRILNGTTLANFQHTDTANNAVTIGAYTDIDTTVATVTAVNEETITIGDGAITSATADGDTFTIDTLNGGDLTTLVFTGSSNKVITNAVANVDGILTTVDASANTGTVSVSVASATVGVNVTGSSTAATTVVGGTVADTITGGTAADVIGGAGGADVINSGGGADTITGGASYDTINLSTGSQRIVQGVADSVSNTNTVSGAVAVGTQMVFGEYVDVVNSFTAGTGGDVLSLVNAGATLATTLLAQTSTALTASTNYFASGNWNALTQTFTITANGAGTDTMIVSAAGSGASLNLNTNANAIILVGVDSDNLVAANFI